VFDESEKENEGEKRKKLQKYLKVQELNQI
jgi:hypothetical protein